jgi:site-specific recombinase XerD
MRADPRGTLGSVASQRYPENLSPILAELPERYARFAELREEFLLGYCYNTARAYWGDLEHLNDWCMERGLDILQLDDKDAKRYLAWMKRRGYSETTVQRRRGTFQLFERSRRVTESTR